MRLRFAFWLNLEKPVENELVETVEQLKEERIFSQTIRDGLRIIPALLAGDPEPLFEKFPWIIDMVLARYAPQPSEPTPPTGGNSSDGINEVANTLMARLENMLEAKGFQSVPPHMKPSQILPPATVDISDIELEVKMAGNDADNNSTWNFMISMALQSKGNVNGLPQEAIDYGLRTGRIPADMARSKKQPAQQLSTGNPKAMDVPQFDAPVFDDLDF